MCSLYWPRLTAVYDTSYWEGEVAVTVALTAEDSPDKLVDVALEMNSSSAVTFCGTEHGLLLESVNSTMKYAGWLAVADFRPGPMTYKFKEN